MAERSTHGERGRTAESNERVRVVGAFDDPAEADEAEHALFDGGYIRDRADENDERDVALAVDVAEERTDSSAERPLDVTVAADDLAPADRREVEELLRAHGAERV